MTTQTPRGINQATGKPITDVELAALSPVSRAFYENPCPTNYVHSSVNSILTCPGCKAFIEVLDSVTD